MIIRKAAENDLENLCILFDNYRRFYKKEGDLPGAAGFLKERMKKQESEVFIAEDDNQKIVGFVQLYPIFSSTRMKRLWLLNDLFVEEGHRGTGISIALIEECKALCRRTDSCGMILETSKDNIVGNKLYHKTGFAADSDHNYYEWTPET